MFKVRVLLEPIITKTLINGVHNCYNLYLLLKCFSKITKIYFLKEAQNKKIQNYIFLNQVGQNL